MAPRSLVRITPADTGRRVTVRSRTHGTPSATDTVGVLVAWQDGVLSIERRDATTVTIGEEDLLAARIVQPTGRPAPPPAGREDRP